MSTHMQNHAGGDRPDRPSDEILRLISDYFDNHFDVAPAADDGECAHAAAANPSSAARMAELSQWILQSPANAQFFARMAAAHSGIYRALQQQDLCDFLAASDADDHLELVVDPRNIREMLHEAAEAERKQAAAEAAARAKALAAEAAAERLRQEERERLNRPRQSSVIEVPRAALWIGLAASLLLAVYAFDLFSPAEKSQRDMVQVAPPVKRDAPETFAAVTGGMMVRWGEGSAPMGPSKRLPAGPLRLEQGVAEITFDDGATVVCEAPVMIELTGSSRLHLASGRLVAHVPEEAIGFTVSTPSGSIIDLGTEFGVDVDAEQGTGIQVLKGAVALASKVKHDASPAVTLTAGEARRIDTNGQLVSEVAFVDNAFLRRVPASPYELAILRGRPLVFWRFDRQDQVIESLGRVAAAGRLGQGVQVAGRSAMAESGLAGEAAADFAGEHLGIAIDDVAELKLLRDFTIETWVKAQAPVSNTGAMRVFSNFFRTPDAHAGYGLGVASEKFIGGGAPRAVLLFTMHGVYDAISTKPIPLDQWVHLVVTVDGQGRPAMFIDGSEVIEFIKGFNQDASNYRPIDPAVDYTMSIRPSGNPFCIGRHPPTNNVGNPSEAWQGSIDELVVFDRVLSADEIADHHQAGLTQRQ